MKILAIIPARGGSKGIPHKNLKMLAGFPLLAWSIRAAQQSRYINRIVVSTDDKAIAEAARQFGAEPIERPASISDDHASSESALLHVLENLKESENYQPDLIVFLQCTSPLTLAEDMDDCIQKLIEDQADTATTVTSFHYFVWKNTASGGGEGINHDKAFRPRRQDREPQYLETGAVYVMRTDGFIKHKHRFFGKTVLSEMPAERVQEIDDPVDLIIAETRLRELSRSEQSKLLPKRIKAVVFDFDGVMTDNKVYVSESGQESVRCDRGDGMGISWLKRTECQIVVMSTEANPVVSARCKKLAIECYQNLGHSKYEALQTWCSNKKIHLEEVVYMGNDLNDLECLKNVGCAVVPSDAQDAVKPYAKIVLENKGGEGAVRALCELILNREPKLT